MKKGLLKSAVLAMMLCGLGSGTGLATTYGVSYEVGGRNELTAQTYESSSVLGNKIYSGGIGGTYNFVTGTVNTIGGTSNLVNGNMVYGSGNTVTSSSNSVFGSTNKIGSATSTVIGEQNKVAHDGTSAITGSTVYECNVALGYQNTIGGVSNAIAIGRGSTVSGEKGIAIGYYANASAEMAVAIGYNAVASTAPKMVVSGSDKTTETWMTTVSFGNQATETGGSAKTYLARLKNIYEGEDDYDAVNVKQLKSYVKDNSGKTYTGTDPITVDNTNNTISIRNMSMGADATGTTGATATGNAAIALGQGASAGVSEKASDYNSNVAIGKGATTTSTTYTPTGGSATTIGTSGSSIAIGTSAKTTGDSAIAIGKESQGTRNNTIAIGASAKAKEAYATALGGSTEASGSCSTAIGFYAKAQSDYAIAIGFATVEKAASNSIAIGNDAKASKENSVAIGKGSKATEANTVSVGSGNSSQAYGFRRIVNVADGTKNTDAATYGQLIKNQEYTFDSSTGIATIKTNGDQTAFTLKLSSNGSVAKTDTGLISGQKVYEEVRPAKDGNYILTKNTTADNLKALDGAIGPKLTENGNYIQKGNSVTTNLSALDTAVKNSYVDGKSYTIDANKRTVDVMNADGSKAFSLTVEASAGGVYTSGDHINIDNDYNISVKTDGKVESGDTGIVTGGTVYEAITDKTGDTSKLTEAGLSDNLTDSILDVNEKVDDVTNQVVDVVNNSLGTIRNDINKVGAGAAALAALHPETFDPSNKLNFAIGYGHYKNANAGAFGAFYKPNQDTTVSAGSTFGNGNPMVNMGVSFKIGKRGQNLAANASNAELVQEVNHLRAQNNRYEEKLDAQEKKIADLEEKMQKLLQKVGKV